VSALPSAPAALPRPSASLYAAAPPPKAKRKSRSWRWLRVAIPYAVVALLLLVSAIAYAWEEPDPTDAAFLSPTSGEDVGAKSLADRLLARGIRIEAEDDFRSESFQ